VDHQVDEFVKDAALKTNFDLLCVACRDVRN
jgi:hypothetical protein